MTIFQYIKNELAKSRVIRACVPTRQKRANILFLRANVPVNVPTCHTACQRAKRSASFLVWRVNVPKDEPIFQTFLLRNAKENIYTLLLYKTFYIIFDIIVIHIIWICIVHKNCIILHFYTTCHIKEKRTEFFFFIILSCSLVRNKNIKRLGLYTLHVTRVLSNFHS